MANTLLKKLFWKLPIGKDLKSRLQKMRFTWMLKREKRYDQLGTIKIKNNQILQGDYIKYIVSTYGKKSEDYTEFSSHEAQEKEVNLIAYYLTQFHPNKHNDDWWGKGVTEWNNVNQAIPQFINHYQPRRPGELGYYDLRMKEVFARQIELANNYGIDAFCFYYYWFDNNERLLDLPLNMFLKNKDLKIKFFYCWANENWTKRFSGTNDDVLMRLTPTVENYKKYIEIVANDFLDERYYLIQGKPVISVYCPSVIPNPTNVLKYWRKYVKVKFDMDLYIIAIQERDVSIDWCMVGFDAESEFQPKQINFNCKDITKTVKPIRSDFSGVVYDYAAAVNDKAYITPENIGRKVYPAVMPMWDNTARRNFRGSIYHGSTPALYREWLSDIIERVKHRKDLDDKMAFINAWNEWGEGAYLEPDDYYGYAYLEATYEAINKEQKVQ